MKTKQPRRSIMLPLLIAFERMWYKIISLILLCELLLHVVVVVVVVSDGTGRKVAEEGC